MKRIAITIAALAISSVAFADANPDEHGDVLKDLDAQQAEQRVSQTRPAQDLRGTDNDFAVGDSETIFDFDIISGGGGQ